VPSVIFEGNFPTTISSSWTTIAVKLVIIATTTIELRQATEQSFCTCTCTCTGRVRWLLQVNIEQLICFDATCFISSTTIELRQASEQSF
jgi:hypothetical protein